VSGATQSSNLASTTFMGSHVRCSRLNYTLFTNSETHIVLARSQPEIERNATISVAVSVSLREIGGEPPTAIFTKFALVN
jgi:hypothetical protein